VETIKESYKEAGDSLFTRSHMEKTRGNGCKLLLGKSRLDTRGSFFTMRTISHWNNLPRAVVDSPTFSDSAGQGAGPSCLDRAFAKKGWTR